MTAHRGSAYKAAGGGSRPLRGASCWMSPPAWRHAEVLLLPDGIHAPARSQPCRLLLTPAQLALEKTPHLKRHTLARQFHEFGDADVHQFHQRSRIDADRKHDHGERHESRHFAQGDVGKLRGHLRSRPVPTPLVAASTGCKTPPVRCLPWRARPQRNSALRCRSTPGIRQ